MYFVVEFLFHLLWLAIVEGLTVEFLISEIQMVRTQSDEHLDDEPESPKTETFPEYVNLTSPTVRAELLINFMQDDPFYEETHPFWRDGWYDTGTGRFYMYQDPQDT